MHFSTVVNNYQEYSIKIYLNKYVNPDKFKIVNYIDMVFTDFDKNIYAPKPEITTIFPINKQAHKINKTNFSLIYTYHKNIHKLNQISPSLKSSRPSAKKISNPSKIQS